MENKVVVSGRVRLARNYHDLSFPDAEHHKDAKLCVERARGVMGEQYSLYQLSALNQVESMALVERHLISLDLLKRKDDGAALIREDKRVSIMVNEEDHLRIQAITTGLTLPEAAGEAFEAEEKLQEACAFSFDPQLGYLTSCPTNTGTGMRASLMLHLPMLTRLKQIGNVNQSVAKLGLTMRGIYGEGSDALGELYQVSNQVTLGRTEEDIIEAVTAVGKQLIDMEQALREHTLTQQPDALQDTLMRSYGIMRYAVQMSANEFMQHWSNLRLGAAMGLIRLSLSTLDELLTSAQDAHTKKYLQANGLSESVEHARCEIVRMALRTDSEEV